MLKFSEAGIKNKSVYESIYSGFIEWCKEIVGEGTFSTYCNGEPVFFSAGIEIPYRAYLASKKKEAE